MRCESVFTLGCHYPTNLNILGHCICVHQENISAAAALEPGSSGLWVNHATNELSWRKIKMQIYILINS